MNIVDLFEKRKNPEINTKTSALAELEKYRGRDDVFVSFTDDVTLGRGQPKRSPSAPKLGINPINRYGTPTGIYSYPINYVLDKKGRVPFAGTLPYIWVIQSTGNLLDLCKYTETDLDDDIEKLEKIHDFTRFARENTRMASVQTPGGKLWYVLMKVAEQYGAETKTRPTTAWAKLIRELGYTGAYDSCGEGIIHNAEPTQAFFVSRSVIKPLEVINNDINKQPPRYSLNYLAKNPETLFKAFDSGSLHFLEFANIVRDEIFEVKNETGNDNGWIRNISDYIGNNENVLEKISSRNVILEILLPYLSSEHVFKCLAFRNGSLDGSLIPTMIAKIMNALQDRKDAHLYHDFLRNQEDFKMHPYEIISAMNSNARLVFDDVIADVVKNVSIPRMFFSLYDNVGPKAKQAIFNNETSYARLAGNGIVPFNKKRILQILNNLGKGDDIASFWFTLEKFHPKLSNNELVDSLKKNHRLKNPQFQELVNMFHDDSRDRLKSALDAALS